MASVPLKFRCYQCNGLLGVSRTKAGAVVACPKCGAELIVPDPAELDLASGGDAPGSMSGPAMVGAAEAAQSLDLLDINPEDIRVEPGVGWEPRPEAPRHPRSEAVVLPLVEERPVSAAPPQEIVSPLLPHSPPPDPEAPTIRFEEPRVTEGRSTVRSRDVVLPRSTVATWSLFVLLAQAMAFTAGLLAGHFLWRVH